MTNSDIGPIVIPHLQRSPATGGYAIVGSWQHRPGGSTSLALGRCHMSRLYGPTHRSLQDRFDTQRLADNVETRVVLTEIPPEHKAFIESRDMFFLSTIDHKGRPTVSYKGGDPGFVRVLDSKPLRSPATTAMACSIRWVNYLEIATWGCCSSISRSHTGCAYRESPASMTAIRC